MDSKNLDFRKYVDITTNIYKFFHSYEQSEIESFDFVEEDELALKQFWKELTFLNSKDLSMHPYIYLMKLAQIEKEKRLWFTTKWHKKDEEIYVKINKSLENIKDNDFKMCILEYGSILERNLIHEFNDDLNELNKKLFNEDYNEDDNTLHRIIRLTYDFESKVGDRENVDKFVEKYKFLFQTGKSDNYYEQHLRKNKYI